MIVRAVRRVNTENMANWKNEHKIARLYYLDGLSQSQIAERFGISTPSVCRILARAREAGIVRISIAADEEGFSELEARIEGDYGLDECRIANSCAEIARILEDLLPRRLSSGGTIGVSWGETLKGVAEELRPGSIPKADVVPALGAMGTVETGIYPNSIAKTFADKLGGRAFLVNAPLVNDSAAMARELFESRSFSSVRELWERIDVALVGCSPVDSQASFARNGIFTCREIRAFGDSGARSVVNFSFLRENGAVMHSDMADRLLHIPLDGMRCFSQVILAAFGTHKTEAVQAALRSGAVSTLIIDAHLGAGL